MKIRNEIIWIILTIVSGIIGQSQELPQLIKDPEIFRLEILSSLVRDHEKYKLASEIRTPAINQNKETGFIDIGDWSLRHEYDGLLGFLGVPEHYRKGYILISHTKNQIGGNIVLLKLDHTQGKWMVSDIFEQGINFRR